MASCRVDSLTWQDVGARNRTSFINECQDDWDRARNALAGSQASAALDVCEDTSVTLESLSCPEVIALYARE